MAAYLSLKHKTTGEVFTGAKLIDLDAMFAGYMGEPVDASKWCMNWMDTIGFMAAISSKPLAEALKPLMDSAEDDDQRKGLQWFIDNFDNHSFMGR